jgi:LEA14-like dessication related protein
MRLLPLLIIGGAATWYLLRMRSLGTNLQFIVRGIKVKGGSIIQPNIIVTIGIQNPTNAEAIVRSLAGTLEYNNQSFANFSSFETTTIKRNSESLINVTATPSLTGVLSVVRDVILNKQRGAVINVNGSANVNNVQLPFNSSFQF